MSNPTATPMLLLEYRDIAALQAGGSLADLPPISPGVPEHEVEQRIAAAHKAAVAATEHRFELTAAQQQTAAREQAATMLGQFARERALYFSGLEESVVQLALAIARKILQRESELDPTLLGGLVRIALDRMQSGSAVQVRVTPKEAGLWRTLAGEGEAARWKVEEDASLSPGDCVVRTDMGEASFGLDVQLLDVEQSFRGLLAHKPGA